MAQQLTSSFQDCQFKPVVDQLDSGFSTGRAFACLLEKVSKLQETFGRDIQRTITEESVNLGVGGPFSHSRDKMLGLKGTVDKFIQFLSKYAIKQLEMAETIRCGIAEPIQTLIKERDQEKNSYIFQEEQLRSKMARSNIDFKKIEKHAQETVINARNKNQVDRPPRIPPLNYAQRGHQRQSSKTVIDDVTDAIGDIAGHVGSFGRSIRKSVSKVFLEDIDFKVEQQDRLKSNNEAMVKRSEYRESMKKANASVDNYYEGVHAFIDKMHEIELERVQFLKLNMKKYLENYERMITDRDLQIAKVEINTALEMYRPAHDIDNFSKRSISETGSLKRPKLHKYDLEPWRTVFTSIQDCVELEQQANPHKKIVVPGLPSALIKALKSTGDGLKTEGIFRLSVSARQIVALKNQLQKMNYDVKPDTPHLAAVMLKEWLRGLEDPLIPYEMYDEVIKQTRLQGWTEQYTVSFVQKLPEYHRIVLEEVIALIVEAGLPENVETSKMTTDNLAIVFAPSFLRNTSNDPMTILRNTEHETRFVLVLVEVYLKRGKF